MHIFDLFFEGGVAIKIIFKIGFIPEEDDFREFSESEYEKYRAEVGEAEGKMFRFREGKMEESKEVFAFSEMEKNKMMEAAELMKHLAKEHPCETNDETLKYLASVMPYPFSKGSKYGEFAKFKQWCGEKMSDSQGKWE